ncbi:DUF4258 domain-containing protein [Acidobacteria bacterium AH-259-L09]|nr:DUF4258 domain-containing protein [Acidobacteria bacterium AH-259-L09]
MKIRIDNHTLERAEERGTNQDEIRDTLESGFPMEAKHGRLAKFKVYDFKRKRLGKFYEQKRVEVIYTVEEATLVSVTVYVFYGQWSDKE